MKTGVVLLDELLAGPAWIAVWVTWLIVINCVGFLFWEAPAGKSVALSFALVVAPWMLAQAQWHGFTKLLALPHVLVWTPLIVGVTWSAAQLPEGPARTWALVWMTTTLISLILDYNDLYRWIRDERDPVS